MWGWRRRSGAGRVDLYSRWTQYVGFGLFSGGALLMVVGGTANTRGVVLPWCVGLLTVVQPFVSIPLVKQGMDCRLGLRAAVGRRLTAALAVVTAALVCGLVALEATGEFAPKQVVPTVLGFVVCQLLGPYALLVAKRRTITLFGAAVTVAVTAAVGMLGGGLRGAFVTATTVPFMSVAMAFSTRGSAWILAVLWELEAAREAQARLAVAEERLRFGRDLHDVLGRNLAVIALKGELAVQLARRGRPEAVEQMVEVQRIAQESQREVREVVRGYRAADLHAELTGAIAVLRAAGVEADVEGDDASALPPEAQSALAWVVREGTTNVLRHGDARRCAIALRVGPTGCAVLTMENDGVDGKRPAGSGSGLLGLRERLAALGGTLTPEPRPGGFRLTAQVPGAPSAREPEAVRAALTERA